jgi:hypothetical protein
VTRYEFFRRRIAPVLFLGMVGLIAYDACQKQERTHSRIVLDLGEARPDVREVNAELIVGGDVIGTFRRVALVGSTIGPCEFEVALPEDTATLQVAVTLHDAHRIITRTIRPIEGSTTTVSLGDELRQPRE